jgi:hypothetical protein
MTEGSRDNVGALFFHARGEPCRAILLLPEVFP